MNCGRINIESKGCKNKGLLIFINRVMRNISKENKFFLHKNNYYFSPIAYGERQLNSLLFPAIKSSSKGAIFDFPLNRKHKYRRRDKYSLGWVDYCVWYDSNRMALFEVKHDWLSCNSKRIRENTTHKWKSIRKQLKSIDNKNIRRYILKQSISGAKVSKVSLLIVTLYSRRIIEPIDESKVQEIIDDAERKLKPKTNWHAFWLLPERIQKMDNNRESEKVKNYLKGIILFAHVSNLIC